MLWRFHVPHHRIHKAVDVHRLKTAEHPQALHLPGAEAGAFTEDDLFLGWCDCLHLHLLTPTQQRGLGESAIRI